MATAQKRAILAPVARASHMSVGEAQAEAEGLSAYTAHREQLQDALRRHGAQFLHTRSAPLPLQSQSQSQSLGGEQEQQQYAGLLNQGATCYLNSLLQTLFMLPEFRNAVIRATATAPVITELKGLFARLLTSTHAALSTKGLTGAFGWSSAEVFQQHDVQELCRILFDGLEDSDTQLGKVIREVFAGDMTDSLSCPKCNSVRKQETTFFDVQLEIQGKSSVQEALNAFLTPEILDENNKWLCEKCNENVQAVKAFEVTRWPPIVTLHLKRFSFDRSSMRRVKLFDEIAIPQSLDLNQFSPPTSTNESEAAETAPPKNVELVSILIQSGTAQGGHYYAYIKDVTSATPRWWEFNDATVRPVDEEEMQAVLDTTNVEEGGVDPEAAEPGTEEAENVVVERKRGKHAASNAYMLLYRDPSLTSTPAELDQALKDAIQAENETHKALVSAYNYQRKLTNLRVFHQYGGTQDLRSISLDVLSTITLAEVVQQVRDRLIEDLGEKAPSDLATSALDCFRVRRYNNATSSPGETFGGKEGQTLKELELTPNATLLLEVRSADQKFEEFDPSDLHVFLSRWDHAANKVDYGAGVRTLTSIPGKKQAKVSDLEAVAREVFALGDKPIGIIKLADREAVVIEGSDKELWKDCRVGSGDLIVIEEQESETSELRTLQWYREQFTSIVVQFNHPSKPQVFEHVLQTSLDQTLRQLLDQIASVLGLPANEIHVKRNANAPQLKELDKTLDKLGIVNNTCLCVCEGETLPPTQHIIEFVIVNDDQDKRTPLCTLPLDENVLIQGVKEVLAEKMQLEKTHIRLRHPSTRAILRDDRRLSRVLLNIHDGMQLFVQALSTPEVIGKDDIIVEVREIDYLRKTIHKGKDMVLRKAATAAEMFERVVQTYPHLLPSGTPPRAPDAPAPAQAAEPSAEAAEADSTNAGAGAGAEAAAPAPTPAGAEGQPEPVAPDVNAQLQNGESAGPNAPPPAAPGETQQQQQQQQQSTLAKNPFAAIIPSARSVHVAKAYSHGPPLTLKSASKLKWNDSAWLDMATVTEPPLSLRDGSVLVVRNAQAYERAKAAARARLQQQQQEGGGAEVRPPATASRFGRLRSRSRDQAQPTPAKEHALKIDFTA